MSESVQLFNLSAASCANTYLESCGRFVECLASCGKASLPSWTSDKSRFVNYLVKLGTRSGSWKKQSMPPESPDGSQNMTRFMGWEGSPCDNFFWLSVYYGLPLRDTAGGWDEWKGQGGEGTLSFLNRFD